MSYQDQNQGPSAPVVVQTQPQSTNKGFMDTLKNNKIIVIIVIIIILAAVWWFFIRKPKNKALAKPPAMHGGADLMDDVMGGVAGQNGYPGTGDYAGPTGYTGTYGGAPATARARNVRQSTA